jgi:hypothetical protein
MEARNYALKHKGSPLKPVIYDSNLARTKTAICAMSRDQQIREAVQVLAPTTANQAECANDVTRVLDRLEFGAEVAGAFRVATSKKGRAALKSYSAALRRLRSSCNALDPAVRPWLSLAMAVSGKAIDLNREIRTAEQLAKQRSAVRGPDSSRRKMAVAAAYDLLGWWGHQPTVTRDGRWAQLAQILADDPAFKPFEHMRRFKRNPSPRVEKVRGNGWIYYRMLQPDPNGASDSAL